MSGLGGHFAFAPQASYHLLDKMGGRSDLRLLALGGIEPRTGQRRLDFCTCHRLRLHYAISLILGHLGRYGKPEGRKGEADERLARVQHSPGGIEIRGELRLGAGMAISYNTNQSVLWAIVHGIFSWIYVVYFVLFDG